MPFLTEELWHGMGYRGDDESIMTRPLAGGPGRGRPGRVGHHARPTITYVDAKHDLIRVGRTLRADYGLPPAQQIDYVIRPSADRRGRGCRPTPPASRPCCGPEPSASTRPSPRPTPCPAGSAHWARSTCRWKGWSTSRPRSKSSLNQLEKLDDDLLKVSRKLENEEFVSKAPAQVVDQQKVRRKNLLEQREKVEKLRDALVAQQG